MHAKSHYHLGQYLIRQYLPASPRRHRYAFLAGCLEPDRNPVTYLKGSIRCHWLRGHHWSNSQRYMGRISRRLERKKLLRLLDYYTLGKLIHYTADAFTFAHNEEFHAGLAEHRSYEAQLEDHFRLYLQQEHPEFCRIPGTVMDTICHHHQKYSFAAGSPARDCVYTLGVCRSIMDALVI